ncbi:hypothetical protein ONS95_006351 [Cadophora gregata]|uniref:uncharacterized protein n=1 Tax=Cadophora gregata TaxID=51156 RepID=UPI0026DD223B|nr:uncharacterized protein ONS95_006351 [Cadophora gregata]KAK0102753.1 hypothetical protein ONS95_006351 [Cadophora gregata]
MSGIEIAGLVLGSFPLLISAAEHYKKGFEPLEKWYKFRTQFITFIDAVDIQKQLFNLALECFLRSIDIEEDELERCMGDGGYEGWRRPELSERLATRLGPSLGVFKSTIQTMNGLVHDLEVILGIKNGQVEWSNEGSNNMDYQLKRLRHSFGNRGPRAVEALKSHNETLRHLLDSTEKLSGLKAKGKKDTTWANVFEAIRRHASSIHTALRAGWSCQCAPHTASLRLEQRKTGGWDSTFNLAFSVPQDPQTIVRREVKIQTRKLKSVGMGLSECQIPNGVARDTSDKTQAGLDAIRQNFEQRSTPIKNLSRPPSSFSAATLSAKSPRSSLKSMFRNSSFNGTEYLGEENLSRTSSITKRLKTPKEIRFAPLANIPVFIVPPPSPTIPQVAETVQVLEIKDFCSIIRDSSANKQCLGYLCDGERLHDVLPLSTDGALERVSSVSLRDIKEDICKLSTQKRIKLATILASSLLQLQTTPWLTGSFENENIFFYRHGQEICLDHPYVRHSFTPTSCPSTNTTQSETELRHATRASLVNLGILLLELCFGQPIESTAIRKKHFVNGSPHPGTDFLTARDWVENVWGRSRNLIRSSKLVYFNPSRRSRTGGTSCSRKRSLRPLWARWMSTL